MRSFKLSASIFAIGLFLAACSSEQPQQTATVEPFPNEAPVTEVAPDQDEVWARENLDLQRVGNLLERSSSPEEFEAYLNDDGGINNLDLNGDGYVDYLSVDEFEDRGDNERGLSIFSRFGPDLIQEIATIIFSRGDRNSRGARILMTGNEQLYGDNYYYETDWADRDLGIVDTLFGGREAYYRSPYYYDNYPDDYQLYQVDQTPVYRSRIEQLYPAPVFSRASNPSIVKVKIKSPHKGEWMNKVHAKLAKPTKEQNEFRKNNPEKPKFVKIDKGGKKDDSFKPDKAPKAVRKVEKEMSKQPKPAKVEKQSGKPDKPGKGGNGKGKKN